MFSIKSNELLVDLVIPVLRIKHPERVDHLSSWPLTGETGDGNGNYC